MHLPRPRRLAAAVAASGLVAALAVAVPVAASGHGTDHSDDARRSVVGGTARNVILLIGDGMGDSEITIARNYEVGAAGRLAMDTLPLTGEYTTYSVDKATGKPDYVTDSAASGSAWATGYKTYDGAISVTRDEKPKATILELAKKAGYRTGNVTTSEIQDATPAVLGSHVTARGCYGPDVTSTTCPTNAIENGGAGSIEEQQLTTRADVLLGGGREYFDQVVKGGKYQGQSVWESARTQGFQRVETAAQLAAVSTRSDAPVLGLFAPGNLVVERTGPVPTAANTTATTCAANTAFPASQPRLVDMATKAIQILDSRAKGSKKGFFLQIEGASIDKRDHAADPCGQIGETVAFDRAVKAALDFQKRQPDTLVVVTADHGHTSQIVEAGSRTTGVTATLTTADGAPMTISYATTPYTATASQQHTGTEVRIAAKGPQASNVLGITDQTELHTTLRRALGLNR